MKLLDYISYFFGVLFMAGGVLGNNLPMFLLGIIVSLTSLLERGLRGSGGRATPSNNILSLIFEEKERRVVEALIKSGAPLRLSEIAAASGLSKVTVYRLLSKLTARGTVLVLKDESGVKRYYINPKLRELFEQQMK